MPKVHRASGTRVAQTDAELGGQTDAELGGKSKRATAGFLRVPLAEYRKRSAAIHRDHAETPTAASIALTVMIRRGIPSDRSL
jgi:hypothetical protein